MADKKGISNTEPILNLLGEKRILNDEGWRQKTEDGGWMAEDERQGPKFDFRFLQFAIADLL